MLIKLVLLSIACAKLAESAKVRDNWSDAEALVEELVHSVNLAATSAISDLDDAYDDLVDYANGMIGNARGQIEQTFYMFKAEFNIIRLQAAEANAEYCVTDREQQFNDLPTNAEMDITFCISSYLAEGTAMLDQYSNEVKSIQKNVVKRRDDLQACHDALDSNQCVEDLVTQVSEELLDVPQEIREDAAFAIENVANAEPDIMRCSTEGVETVSFKGQAILADMTECISNSGKTDQK